MARYTGETGMMDTVRDNPLPLALMGLGIGWLVFSGMRQERQERGSDYSGASVGRGYGRPQGGEAYNAGAGYGAYDSSDYGGADYTGYSDYTPGEYGTEETRSRLRGGTTSGTRKEMRERAARLQGRAQELADTTRTRLSTAGRTVRDRASSLAGRSGETYRDHPLMMSSVAMLIGAAIGAALPRTRGEDEVLGRSSEELRHRAREAGEEALDRAKHVASRTVEAARESGEEAYQRVKGAAKQSAEEAMDTGKGPSGEDIDKVAREESDRQPGGEGGRLH